MHWGFLGLWQIIGRHYSQTEAAVLVELADGIEL